MRLRTVTFAISLLFLFFGTAAADTGLLLPLDGVFAGAMPPGDAPWVTASFQPGVVAGTVELTLTSHLTGNMFLSEIFFNFSPSAGLSSLSATGPYFVDIGLNDFKADGDGFYDIHIGLPTGDESHFGAGSLPLTFIFSDSLGGSVTPSQFNTLSAPGPGGSGSVPLVAMGHVQGIPGATGGTTSAWITVVPEPSAAGPLAIGLLLLLTGYSGTSYANKRK